MKDTARWTITKLSRRLGLIESLVYQKRLTIPPFSYHPLEHYPYADPLKTAEATTEWTPILPGEYWGDWRRNFILKGEFTIPTGWGEGKATALYLPLGDSGDFCHPEVLVFVDGKQLASCDRYHQEISLPESYQDGKRHAIYLIGWTGLGEKAKGNETLLLMKPCSVVQINQETRKLVILARVTLGLLKQMENNNATKWALVSALDKAFLRLNLIEPLGGEEFYESAIQANQILEAELKKAGQPTAVEVTAAGHAHIDVAWLWPLEQTRRKARHTFKTVIELMKQYPDLYFTQSQPQLYDFIRQDAPELFEEIKQKVAEGKWEPIGGMWVEADCNLTGAESLARQFLLGRQFFTRYFGKDSDSKVLWLPDVFGYAWNLPQLIKLAGMEYFFTIKIGWNQYNRLPYDSFWWEGVDGTRILTHFSPTPEAGTVDSGFGASTYNATIEPEQVIGSWTNFQQKELVSGDKDLPVLMAYGYGDGGGGPTREMLENLVAMKAFPGTPKVKGGKVEKFFDELKANEGDQLPTWNGELYFELHRGTYTTQSRNKRANRKSEFALHDAEFLATLASLVNSSYAYPQSTLGKAWELVCLNQFHDIIPGSSIHDVYVESQAQYGEIQALTEQVGAQAKAAIEQAASQQEGKSLWLGNPSSFTRKDLAFWPGKLEEGNHLEAQGEPVAYQSTSDGTWVEPLSSKPYSAAALQVVKGAAKAQKTETGLIAKKDLLENAFIRVELNAEGDITRIYDKVAGREVMPKGTLANQFQAFEDRPMNWDAWDLDIFYDEHQYQSQPAQSIEVVETGPLHATLKIKRTILQSEYVQTISLSANSPRLDFDTKIAWQQKHILLKVAFPVDVLSPSATYEIQWGNVERPTHRNTSWDWARFETCAQKWVDLSEGNYGVSLMNDCKYGHDIRENVMRLSLLRGTTYPDPVADQGEHQFKYSLMPHTGKVGEATLQEAYALNDPLIVWEGAAKTAGKGQSLPASLVSTDATNIIIETVKQAEDGKGIIVRLYDSLRCRGKVTLHTGFAVKQAYKTNLLEETLESIEVSGNDVYLQVHPFEIVTLRLIPA